MQTRTARHLPMGEVTTRPKVDWIAKSAAAGAVGGAAMILLTMVGAWLTGYGPWAPVRAIAGTFLGDAYAGRGFEAGPVLAGLAIHFGLSMAFGIVFAAAIAMLTTRLPHLFLKLWSGMMWGFLLWAVNTYVVADALPGGSLLNDFVAVDALAADSPRNGAMPEVLWFAGHLLYGAVLGWTYATLRRERTEVTEQP